MILSSWNLNISPDSFLRISIIISKQFLPLILQVFTYFFALFESTNSEILMEINNYYDPIESLFICIAAWVAEDFERGLDSVEFAGRTELGLIQKNI